ncbi:MAG: T9SS type A sorting domain-containing protein [Mariniphaga sp.]
MKKIKELFFLLFVLRFSILPAFAQNFAGTVIDYVPAPGQHINVESLGTPMAAEKMAENTSSLVSLGSFGGYLVLKFNEPCINHPDNPYGIDFTIFGNAFSGSSEPGSIWIMEDSNKNDIPDDTWYEIAGSSHFFSATVKNYQVTYFKTTTRDVFWKDNRGKTGYITANDFHLQEYYPDSGYFPSYPQDSVSFTGILLNSNFITSSSTEYRLAAPAFGYADSHSRVQYVDLSLPDNPYTEEVEGAGGDPVDISWAIDSSGNYIELDSIHFVKIVSASLDMAGWLGEVSTDVAWVQAVQPQPQISGKKSLLVVGPHPPKMILGDSLKLDALYFEKGRVSGEQVSIYSYDESVATVDTSGMFMARSRGEVQIRFSAGNETVYSTVKIVVPDSIRFLTDFSAVYPGDTLELITDVYDNDLEEINLIPRFSSSSPATGKIITVDNKAFLVALEPGDFSLTASIDEFNVYEEAMVKIHSNHHEANILLSIKTADENLLPLQLLEVNLADWNASVENRQNDYSGLENITLFHALSTGLQKAKVSFKFRDDFAAEGSLYLYMVENDGLFSYGWGGLTYPESYARAWIARLNSKQYLNGFDNIMLSAGDTVILYHVPDVLSDWTLTRMFSDKYKIASGESLDILLEKSSCALNDGEVTESAFIPVSNAPVTAGSTWYTDASGKVDITPEGEFPLVVSSGNDAVLIKTETAVSAGSPSYDFTLYPNPVEDWLFIGGGFSGSNSGGTCRIKLLGSAGTVFMEKEVLSMPVQLDLSSLAPGMYHLLIADGEKLEIQKIIKR